jgi:hypothetical protein
MNTEDIDSDKDPDLESALLEFHSAGLIGMERSEQFWATQRRAIMTGVAHGRRPVPFRFVLAWGVAVAVVLVVIGVWVDVPRALPAPDFAGGYDQDLLGDVERMVDAEIPSSLAPALLLTDEIREGKSQGGAPQSPDPQKK